MIICVRVDFCLRRSVSDVLFRYLRFHIHALPFFCSSFYANRLLLFILESFRGKFIIEPPRRDCFYFIRDFYITVTFLITSLGGMSM